MSISIQPLFAQKVRQFATSADHDGFVRDFTIAVNLTAQEYATSLDLASVPTAITALNQTWDVSADREYGLSAGIDMHLIEMGHKNGELDVATAQRRWELFLNKLRYDRDRLEIAAATDGEVICDLSDD